MRFYLVFALVACGSRSQEKNPDCALIEKDPASAPAKLSEKYPSNPVKVSETIERCIAPAGETCERMAKIWAAIPSMMPGAGSGSGAVPPPMPTERTIELCKGMPPEMQRCMLPSYIAGHAAECKQVLDDMAITPITSIKITPSGSGTTWMPAPDCDELTIELGKDKIRYARGADAATLALFDQDGLEAGLKQLAAICVGPTALKADPDASYQDMIRVMDLAHKVGFSEIGVDAGQPPRPRKPPLTQTGIPKGKNALQTAPVIVITRTDVIVEGKTLVTVDMDATDPVRAALAARVLDPDDATGLAILQADRATSARTINQVIVGAQRAGYDNLLFAVKNN